MWEADPVQHGCVLLNAATCADDVLPTLIDVIGMALPREPGPMTRQGASCAVWLTPRSWLIRCPVNDESELAERINRAFPDKSVHACLYGDSLEWVPIAGSEAQALLSEAGFVSLERDGLPIGFAKRTAFATVSALIVREAEHAWHIGVERSRSRYLMEWIDSVRSREAVLASASSANHP